jgi:hypothetical protein
MYIYMYINLEMTPHQVHYNNGAAICSLGGIIG